MKYCTKCVLPDTRPGVVLDDEGVCSACRHAEHRSKVDWKQREKMFAKLCNDYRRKTEGEYDCVIAVSSGKDSYYQVAKLLDYGMNPLLVSVDNLDWSKTGLQNRDNLLNIFDCDCIVHRSSIELNRKISRLIFEKDGFIAWLFDRLIYTFPLHIATKFNIPFVIYGENTSLEYGGPLKEETPDASQQINNDVVRDYGWETFTKAGISMDELVMAQMPSIEDIKRVKLDPRYLSYYFNWSGYEHMKVAKQCGWKSLNDTDEWSREGYIEDYDQIDDIAYLVDPWMKYPKYGHARATDVSCYWIRDGLSTREEAIKQVKEHDHKLDPLALEHYLKFSGYTYEEFWKIVETFINKDIFKQIKKGIPETSLDFNKHWELKNPIW